MFRALALFLVLSGNCFADEVLCHFEEPIDIEYRYVPIQKGRVSLELTFPKIVDAELFGLLVVHHGPSITRFNLAFERYEDEYTASIELAKSHSRLVIHVQYMYASCPATQVIEFVSGRRVK
jgi:hypothetical protein